MSEELARWAAKRSADLRARAEAEAVIVLRDALVAAALAEGPPRVPERPAPRGEPVKGAEPGELLWVYCVMQADDDAPHGMNGVTAPVRRVEAAGLAALVSTVPRSEFGEEPLRENLNDLPWLERVARAHESVLDQALSAAPIVPLRLCTLYASEEGVRQMLAREREAFAHALDYLAGRQEWGVKVLIDTGMLEDRARRDADAQPPKEARGEGGAYMLRRRFEREVRERARSLAAEIADRVHTRLEAFALDAVKRAPQNRDLSGHEGEMVLNAAYLVDAERVEEFSDLVSALEAEHGELGAHIELTGPWPPYNFVPGGGTASIA